MQRVPGKRALRRDSDAHVDDADIEASRSAAVVRRCRCSLGAACGLPRAAQAQQVVVVVNGEPITELDIEQRTKLIELVDPQGAAAAGGDRGADRREAQDREGKDVTASRSATRGRHRLRQHGAAACGSPPTSSPRTAGETGVNAATLKARIRADMIWHQLVRGRYSVEPADQRQGHCSTLTDRASPTSGVGYDYTLRPILFLVPAGSPRARHRGRATEAEALRGRFQELRRGLALARALQGRRGARPGHPQLGRPSAELRKVLDSVRVGQLTAPETTKHGIEMFALCGKNEINGRNAPARRRVREADCSAEALRAAVQDNISDELRRGAMIEYK